MADPAAPVDRETLALEYLDSLPYEPYPVQERAILEWFDSDEGVLVCAPTGTGKTLIAEAALQEALKTGTRAYYTTPLIALTEQKFAELQDAAERWGYSRDDVGLVTGNRRENPGAKLLVVVAEILLNRLLHQDDDGEGFDWSDTTGVVMDEFHSFNDPDRGVVWELSLALLPKHVRLMLLSATVGNAVEFLAWLRNAHGRNLRLAASDDRKVPLSFHWHGEELLGDFLTELATGEGDARGTPALVFCFNRAECWSVAEQLRGRSLLASGQQKELAAALEEYDWKGGAGPKLKQVLMRGVGVHHAGLLPKHRRCVEELFQRKLLTVCVCTETLAAGLNLPARSVVLTSLMKGPRNKKRIVEASQAFQMFGRAGRPQYDDRGYVHVLAHEDDVKIAAHKRKIDQIPEDTKDPQLIKARKRLIKKGPKRRSEIAYWSEAQFEKLLEAPPGKLASRGALPWRLLAYLLTLSPDVTRLRDFVNRRLLTDDRKTQALKQLDRRLLALHREGYVTLSPDPPVERRSQTVHLRDPEAALPSEPEPEPIAEEEITFDEPAKPTLFGQLLNEALAEADDAPKATPKPSKEAASERDAPAADEEDSPYRAEMAQPCESLRGLLVFRSIPPLYGDFLMRLLGHADRAERIQALESVLELPLSLGPGVRVPKPDDLPPGPLARSYVDIELIERGLATPEQIQPPEDQSDLPPHERIYALTLGDKLRLLFEDEVPEAAGSDLRISPVWVAGEVLRFGDFYRYISAKDLAKQEGLVFRHLLRMILLCDEVSARTPDGTTDDAWLADLDAIRDGLTNICRAVDESSTDEVLATPEADPMTEAATLVPRRLGQITRPSDRPTTEDDSVFADGVSEGGGEGEAFGAEL